MRNEYEANAELARMAHAMEMGKAWGDLYKVKPAPKHQCKPRGILARLLALFGI